MNTRRLMMTANLLRNLPAARLVNPKLPTEFEMNVWSCGTAACAVGHAMYDKAHQEEGLSLSRRGLIVEPQYGAAAPGFPSVNAFYGIDYAQAKELFFIRSYEPDSVTPEAVAERIEELVNSR